MKFINCQSSAILYRFGLQNGNYFVVYYPKSAKVLPYNSGAYLSCQSLNFFLPKQPSKTFYLSLYGCFPEKIMDLVRRITITIIYFTRCNSRACQFKDKSKTHLGRNAVHTYTYNRDIK